MKIFCTKQRFTSYPRAEYLKELSKTKMRYAIVFQKDKDLQFADIFSDETSCW